MPKKFTQKRIAISLGALVALGTLGVGGSALASGLDGGDQQARGPQAEQAKQAAVRSLGSGTATDVSNDAASTSDKGEKTDSGDAARPAYQPQIVWNVDVAKSDGSSVTVHLDKAFKVLGTESAGREGD